MIGLLFLGGLPGDAFRKSDAFASSLAGYWFTTRGSDTGHYRDAPEVGAGTWRRVITLELLVASSAEAAPAAPGGPQTGLRRPCRAPYALMAAGSGHRRATAGPGRIRYKRARGTGTLATFPGGVGACGPWSPQMRSPRPPRWTGSSQGPPLMRCCFRKPNFAALLVLPGSPGRAANTAGTLLRPWRTGHKRTRAEADAWSQCPGGVASRRTTLPMMGSSTGST